MEQILISKDNCINILKGLVNDLYNKINNKDLSTPYIEQFKKAGIIKVNGLGDMFLCNNGEYIKIDLNNIEDVNNKIQTIYDLFKIEYQKAEWNSIPINTPFRKYTGSSSYNGKLYRVGGNDNDTASNITDVYDIEADSWTILKSYPKAIWNIGVHYFNEKIYAIGGTDDYYIYDNNYIYDIATDTWSNGTNVNTKRMGFMSDLYDEKIYCVGGGWGTEPLNSTEIYDIKTNSWSYSKPLITPVTASSGICYNTKLYVFGGYSISENKNIIQIYDIITNTWEQKILNVPYTGFGLFIYNNEIYKVGINALDCISIYDIENNKWVKTNINDIEKRGFSYCIYNKKLYCIGGITGTPGQIGIPNNNNDILTLPYSNYDIKLPDELDNKLNIIKYDGLGNKLLADNGTYIDPSNNYVVIQDNEISDLVNQICIKEV